MSLHFSLLNLMAAADKLTSTQQNFVFAYVIMVLLRSYLTGTETFTDISSVD